MRSPVGAPERGPVRLGHLGLAAACCLLPIASAALGERVERFREADPFDAGRPVCRRFEDVDGLPQNTVHAILVDREGLLWAGTQDGAASFDGHSWERVDLPNGLRSNFVRSMLETADGALWVGSQAGGLARRRDGKWTVFEPGDSGLPDDRVNALVERQRPDGGYELWIGTHEGGVVRYDGENWTVFAVAAGLPSAQIWDLLVTQEAGGERLWIGTGAGLTSLRLSDGAVETPPGAPRDSVSSVLSLADSDGSSSLWVGTYGAGLWRLRAGEWSRVGPAEGLPNLFLTDLAPSPSGGPGAFWIATDGGGLAQHQGGRIRALDLGADLSSRAAYKVLETTTEQGAQAVWIGTRNNGLLRLVDGFWRTFQPFPETPNVPVNAILYRVEDGGARSLWIGTDGFGLAIRRDGGWRRLSSMSGAIGNDTVMAITETKSVGRGSRVWVGTRHGGLSVLQGDRWRRFTVAGGELPNDMVQALAEEVGEPGKGKLWVGTRDGLASFDGTTWNRGEARDGFPQGSVLSLLSSTSPSGARELWIGTTDGLSVRDGAGWRRWDARSGLTNAAVQALHLRTMESGRRELWIGTDGGGALWLDPDDPSSGPQASDQAGYPMLPNGTVYAILEDDSRRLYVLTNSGVSRLTPGSGTGLPGHLDHFTTEHGLPLNQGNRGAFQKDPEGRLWFGTVGGAAAFDPQLELVDRRPKRMRLAASALDCDDCELCDGGLLDHDQNRILFRYSLLSFFGERLTRFRSQLEGHEPTATGWGAAAEREVGGLPGGRYLFRVWGRDVAGNIAGPAELSFTIRPAPWQTHSARALAALVLGGLGFGFFRARSRAHAQRERALEELVDAKTRRLQRANAQLVELSFVDALTSVPNRRRFDEQFAEEWKRSLRSGASIGLVLIDIDNFKGYNDAYGHLQGDDCLRQVASAMADGLARAGDVIARYGGEEFAVILPATVSAGALLVAEALRRRVVALGLSNSGARGQRLVTVSCGVAAMVPTLDSDPADLFRRADEALYRAKRAGGNESAIA